MKPQHINFAFDVHFYPRKHSCSMSSNDDIWLKVHCVGRTVEVDMHYAVLDKLNYAKIIPYFRQHTFHIMNPKTTTTHIPKKRPRQHSCDHFPTTRARQMTSTIFTTTNIAHNCFYFSISARTFESTARSSSSMKWWSVCSVRTKSRTSYTSSVSWSITHLACFG